MDVVTLKLLPRSVIGKKVKQLRREGFVPVHVYGRGVESQALQAETQVLRRVLPRVGTNIPLSLELDGDKGENICFVREVQRHPVTEDVLHVDFLRVDVSRASASFRRQARQCPCETHRRGRASVLRGDLRGQWTNLRHLSPSQQQPHPRPGIHRHVARRRPALRR